VRYRVTVEFDTETELLDVPLARVANKVINVLLPDGKEDTVKNVHTIVTTV
jgi:hypothetical protein